MPTRTDRGDFLSRLRSVEPGLAKRENIEQSSCFVFKDGNIITYNEEVSCHIKSGLGKDFVGAVLAQPLITLLDKMKEEEIGVEGTKSEFIVTGDHGFQAGIRMDDKVSMPMEGLEMPDKDDWTDITADWDSAIDVVGSCASKDSNQGRFILLCIHIAPKWMEACDDQQLIRYQINTGVKEGILVRQAAIKDSVALGMVQIAETPAWLHLRNNKGLVYSCRRYMEEYQPLEKHLDIKGASITLPGSLAEEVVKAELFSTENPDSNLVTVDLKPGKMRVSGRGVTGWVKGKIKRIVYNGPTIAFTISPKMLLEISNRASQCEVTDKRIKLNSDKWTYVGCLNKVGDQ